VVAVEGAGREASQALLALTKTICALTAAKGLTPWCRALEVIAAHSVRAGSAFAAALLPALAGMPERARGSTPRPVR
jgi:hypothetical protein